MLGLLCIGAVAFGQSPTINATNGVLNSADYSTSFAPGGLFSIFGANLASTTQQAGSYPLPSTLGGASVVIVATGEQCPLWYVSPTQINAQMPYDVGAGSVQVQVRTAVGVSNTPTITVSARAPKIFSLDFSGQGPAVVTTPSAQILTTATPAAPAQNIVLWMNSMGAVTGSIVAGQPAPGLAAGSQLSTVTDTVTATVGGINAPVTFAGLSPGSVGLYQVNLQAPFVVLTGPVAVTVTVGGQTTQTAMTIPYQQMGFYFSLLGGKAVAGQTLSGVTGSSSALAYRQTDQVTWGTNGYNAWTDNTGNGNQYSVATGVALTLMNGSAIVYDNNGIESATTGTFYDNTGGGANSQKPGLSDLYSMSNYFPLVFSGYFKLAQATTVTSLIGYFDPLGNATPVFDPSNPYLRYRMNIWSEATGPLPKETGNFTGDVFSSDTVAGTFSYSTTAVNMVSSKAGDKPKSIYRLTYQLAAPLTLPAGEYWFSHDASIRATPGASSTAHFVTAEQYTQLIQTQTKHREPIHFSLFGQEMTWERGWEMPETVVVRPDAPVIEH